MARQAPLDRGDFGCAGLKSPLERGVARSAGVCGVAIVRCEMFRSGRIERAEERIPFLQTLARAGGELDDARLRGDAADVLHCEVALEAQHVGDVDLG